MSLFPCPYLKGEVELTEKRERHIAERHPDLLPEHRERVGETLATRTKSGGAFGSEAPSCSRDGTLMCREASISWWLSSASLTRQSVTGSSRPT